MDQKTKKERQQAFDSLPQGIREKLTPEEKELFLTAEVWPETLFEKLDEFLIKEQK
ncbi:MAG: hypothetical protein ABR534_00305 [Desulfotignum sp.]|nr:hypothetical protein [Desulfobacteraceae bacterium]